MTRRPSQVTRSTCTRRCDSFFATTGSTRHLRRQGVLPTAWTPARRWLLPAETAPLWRVPETGKTDRRFFHFHMCSSEDRTDPGLGWTMSESFGRISSYIEQCGNKEQLVDLVNLLPAQRPLGS